MDNAVKPVFVLFEKPINTVTNRQPTGVCEISEEGRVIYDVPQNTPFVAVGRAKVGESNYFMDAESFGDAVKTGTPNSLQGIKSTDLTLDPSVEALTPEEDSEKVPVRILPPDPNKFKQTYQQYLGIVDYKALGSTIIHDIEGVAPDVELHLGQIIHVAGTFKKGDTDYYRTAESVANSVWYGIPAELCTRDLDDMPEDEVDRISDELFGEPYSPRAKVIAAVASTDGFFSRLFKRKRKVIE